MVDTLEKALKSVKLASYSDLIKNNKTVLIERENPAGQRFVINQLIKESVSKNMSIIILNPDMKNIKTDTQSFLDKKGYVSLMNPSFKYINSTIKNQDKQCILFNDDIGDYFSCVEYLCIAAKNLLEVNNKTVVIINNFEKIYNEEDDKFMIEVYFKLLEPLFKKDISVIFIGKPIYNNISKANTILSYVDLYLVCSLTPMDYSIGSDGFKRTLEASKNIAGSDGVNLVTNSKFFTDKQLEQLMLMTYGLLIDFNNNVCRKFKRF